MAVETSGAVPTGHAWKLRIGDWVTFEFVNGAIGVGEIVDLDPYRTGWFEIDAPPCLCVVHADDLTFAGIERPPSPDGEEA